MALVLLWIAAIASVIAAVAAVGAAGYVARLLSAFERVAAAESAADAPDAACQHPAHLRLEMSTMGIERWKCDRNLGGCGFELKRARVRAHAGVTS